MAGNAAHALIAMGSATPEEPAQEEQEAPPGTQIVTGCQVAEMFSSRAKGGKMEA
jgi:hypothetical protein